MKSNDNRVMPFSLESNINSCETTDNHAVIRDKKKEVNVGVILDKSEFDNSKPDRLFALKIDKIKKSGSLEKNGFLQSLSFIMGGFNPIEEVQLMEATIDAAELNNSYKDIFTNSSVIGGLIIAFCFTGTQFRINPPTSISTIWGDALNQSAILSDIYGLLIASTMIFAFILINYSVFWLTMLSQIPSVETSNLFQIVGAVRIQIVFVLFYITVVFFMLASLLQITMNYSAWVAIIVLSSSLLGLFVTVFTTWGIQMCRMETLRFYYEKQLGKNNTLVVEK